MPKRKFCPGDWAKIKYGENAGRYAKVCMLDKDGKYGVIPYINDREPGEMVLLSARSMDKAEPFMLGGEELKRFIRGEIFYRDIKENVFPEFNIKAAEKIPITAGDIAAALRNINSRNGCLALFREWFWCMINIFYDDLEIKERYRPDFFSDAPENDDDIFSVCYGLTEKLYWKMEEHLSIHEENMERSMIKFDNEVRWEPPAGAGVIEEETYRSVCEDIISRAEVYEYNRILPRSEWIYSDSEKRHILSGYEGPESLREATPAALELYRSFVNDLYIKGDPEAASLLAWGYYEGNEAFEQNWEKAEQCMLSLYNGTGDPYAANALGYIYFYGRTNSSLPDYEKAFKYFSYAALDGNSEAICKAADMLISGLGIPKNTEMGLNILAAGYQDCLDEFESGTYTGKLAEYALRMGNASREGMICDLGMRDAYKFYLEAEYAIKRRMKEGQYFGDEHVLKDIMRSLARIRMKMGSDVRRDSIKCDFPLYLNQLFDDRFPLKVQIKTSKDGKTGKLIINRYRFGAEMVSRGIIPEELIPEQFVRADRVLVAFPEMSCAALVAGLEYELEDITVVSKKEKGPYFFAAGFNKNDRTDALEFFMNGEIVAAIDAKWYVLRRSGILKLEKESEKEYDNKKD